MPFNEWQDFFLQLEKILLQCSPVKPEKGLQAGIFIPVAEDKHPELGGAFHLNNMTHVFEVTPDIQHI
jgi:hypothetical protein